MNKIPEFEEGPSIEDCYIKEVSPWQTKSILRQAYNPNLEYHLPVNRPNWWWRLWQYLILGLVWEEVK